VGGPLVVSIADGRGGCTLGAAWPVPGDEVGIHSEESMGLCVVSGAHCIARRWWSSEHFPTVSESWVRVVESWPRSMRAAFRVLPFCP
jgi:hypothetical protein